MNNDSTIQQGMFPINQNMMRVENALIEEINISNTETGYILISYGLQDQNNMFQQDQIRLNVSQNTIIITENNDPLNLSDLSERMRIDAVFSSAMTRSIPPQSNAYRIIVLSEEPSVNVTTDRVVNVDVNNGFITAGNPYDMYDQMIFNISDETMILDQDDNQISLMEIQPGQLVRVEHAIFQTLSIPPQSPAYRIQIL